ncbi:MAG: hypothetical protein CL675_14015 [Bdellovibrionaceae bacterium]|nr:hypothetical protein [Pseudobdellovibrionaceae bacterium]
MGQPKHLPDTKTFVAAFMVSKKPRKVFTRKATGLISQPQLPVSRKTRRHSKFNLMAIVERTLTGKIPSVIASYVAQCKEEHPDDSEAYERFGEHMTRTLVEIALHYRHGPWANIGSNDGEFFENMLYAIETADKETAMSYVKKASKTLLHRI